MCQPVVGIHFWATVTTHMKFLWHTYHHNRCIITVSTCTHIKYGLNPPNTCKQTNKRMYVCTYTHIHWFCLFITQYLNNFMICVGLSCGTPFYGCLFIFLFFFLHCLPLFGATCSFQNRYKDGIFNSHNTLMPAVKATIALFYHPYPPQKHFYPLLSLLILLLQILLLLLLLFSLHCCMYSHVCVVGLCHYAIIWSVSFY